MIFWAGFGLRVAVILIGHTYKIRVPMDHFGFGWEMGRIARSIVLGQGYANPFNGPSGPTAWTPPLYPLLMALSFKLFGLYTNAAALFLLVVNSAFSAGIAPAVYEIAARCFDARGIARRSGRFFGHEAAEPVALWSAWLWAVYPAALQYAIHWLWEMSVSTFLFTWIVVLALRLRGTGEDRAQGPEGRAQYPGAQGSGPRAQQAWLWVGFGAMWGLLMLSNASLVLCLPAMIVWVAWPGFKSGRRLRFWRECLVGAVLSGGVMVLVMLPWMVRNERVLHAFVPTRSNLGVELYESTLDENEGLPWGTSLPLWPGDPDFKLFVRLGEVKYGAMRSHEAIERIRRCPTVFLIRSANRFLYFWDGVPHPPEGRLLAEYLRNLSYSFLSACGLLGIALMAQRRVGGCVLFVLIFSLLPLPYYFITVQPRFRHPLEPLISVVAVYLFRSCSEYRRPLP